MKLRALCISTLAGMIAVSALACGPMASEPQSSTSNRKDNKSRSSTTATETKNMAPGRDKYTRRRIKELKQSTREYEKAQALADKMDLAVGLLPRAPSPEAERRYLINRFEYLALKAERGRATSDDIAEMRHIQRQLLKR